MSSGVKIEREIEAKEREARLMIAEIYPLLQRIPEADLPDVVDCIEAALNQAKEAASKAETRCGIRSKVKR
jgi:hypothetical protein